jgi:hypothetical protein
MPPIVPDWWGSRFQRARENQWHDQGPASKLVSRFAIVSRFAEGVGSGVFSLWQFGESLRLDVRRFLFRWGGRFLRPQRARPAGERDRLAKGGEPRTTPTPHVLVTWVKKIRRLIIVKQSDSPSGQAGWGLVQAGGRVIAAQSDSPSARGGWGLMPRNKNGLKPPKTTPDPVAALPSLPSLPLRTCKPNPTVIVLPVLKSTATWSQPPLSVMVPVPFFTKPARRRSVANL